MLALLSPSGRAMNVRSRDPLRMKFTIKASFESPRKRWSASSQNMNIVKNQKTKKYKKRPEESLRKRRKTPRGPYVFTRGVLNQCEDANGMQIIKTVEELGLDALISEIDFQGCLKNEVILNLSSTKISKGYFLTGNIETELKLKCGRCGTGFLQPYKGKFQVWTNSKANGFEDCVDFDEVPFPNSSNYLDLSEVVLDCIEMQTPFKCLCGTPSCAEGMVVGSDGIPCWIAGDTDSYILQNSSALIYLRDKFKEREGKKKQ